MRAAAHNSSRCGLVPDPPRNDEMSTMPRDPASAEVAPGLASSGPGAANCPLRSLVLAVQQELREERKAAKRARHAARERARYIRNRDKESERVRSYYARNREARLAYERLRYREKREEVLRRTKSREVGVPVGQLFPQEVAR